MAASLNKVFLMGNLTMDPELRYIPSGKAVAKLNLAVNRVYKSTTGERKEDVLFIRVDVWGKMAENCGEYLTKGQPILVEGRLNLSRWEGKDGQKKSSIDVIASNIQFLGSKGDRAARPTAGAPAASGNSGKEDYPEIQSIDVEQDLGSNETPF